MSTLYAPTPCRPPACLPPGSSTRQARMAALSGLPESGVAQAFLAMPFDTLRYQYASSVRAGLVPRSILASAQSERVIDTLEKLILGPIARQR